MHIIQSGRSSAANRSVVRTSEFMATRVDNGGFKYIDITNQPKRFPIDLGDGRIVFSETHRTAEEFLAAGRAEIMDRLEAGRARRQARVWNQAQDSLKPVRKPIFDRKQVVGQDKLSQLIRMEMNKMQEAK